MKWLALVTLMALPAQADEFWSRHRQQRAQWLAHQAPLNAATDGRARPDTTGAIDYQRLRIVMTLTDGRVLPETARFDVTVRVGDSPLQALPLLAFFFEPLAVTRADGTPLDFRRSPQTGELIIALPRPAPPNTGLTVQIEAGFLEYCQSPSGCVDEGELRHLAEFGWYPLSAEFPIDDRFEVEMELRVPRTLTPAATGARRGMRRDGDAVIWQFATELPTVLPAFAVGPYPFEAIGDVIEIFTPRRSVDGGAFLGGWATDVLSLYDALLGPYPFSRLGIAPISDDAGVGLGPQAQIFLPAVAWLIDANVPEAALVREVTAHEIGHQYFFNLIGVVDPSDGWMSEGFAEYAATRASEVQTGTRDHVRLNYWDYVLLIDELADAPLASEEAGRSPVQVRILVLYNKGSAVLEQLRVRLADFDDALRDYVAAFAEQITTTREFQVFLEERTGVELAQFFDQWVYGAGFPRLTVRAIRPGDRAAALTLEIEQAESRRGRFRGEVRVRGHAADGSTSDQPVAIERSVQEIALGQSQWLEFDPELSIFRRLAIDPPADVNLSGVVDGMDLLDVLWAQGRNVPDPNWRDELDTNRDQSIDERDLARVLDLFGQGW